MRKLLVVLAVVFLMIATAQSQENNQNQSQETNINAEARSGTVESTINNESSPSATAVLYEEGDIIAPQSVVQIEATEPRIQGPIVYGVTPPWMIPSSQLPNSGSGIREGMSRVHTGWCTMDDCPTFTDLAKYLVKCSNPKSKVVTQTVTGYDYNLRPTVRTLKCEKKGQKGVLTLQNTNGFEKVRWLKYMVNMEDRALSRQDPDLGMWVDALGANINFLTLAQTYEHVGKIVVVGDTKHDISEVADIVKGLARIGGVDLALLTSSMHLKNQTMAMQPGAGGNRAGQDLGLTGVLSGIFTDAQMKGQPWVALYCYQKRDAPPLPPPPGLVAAYQQNGNGNGHQNDDQMVPNPSVYPK